MRFLRLQFDCLNGKPPTMLMQSSARGRFNVREIRSIPRGASRCHEDENLNIDPTKCGTALAPSYRLATTPRWMRVILQYGVWVNATGTQQTYTSHELLAYLYDGTKPLSAYGYARALRPPTTVSRPSAQMKSAVWCT